VVIGNSKDLIAIKTKKPVLIAKDAFVLGFPDYGGNAVALPGTKVEIDGINKILTSSGYKVSKREQKEASEGSLKAVKGPSLMHIATHGYFLADADLKGNDAMGVNAENAKNNPLLRSGLILSGVPASGQDKTSADLQSNDNGVLTAYEAMNLSLEGTDLIVLSACETGLGDVRAGEGVYGLQRAFLVAGANALIMSLWKVDDAATQQLMTNFYTNWTKSGNKQKAFKQAQLQLMTKYKEPYYWGAFVMMGM
jgi:CHAT domain-containing protein